MISILKKITVKYIVLIVALCSASYAGAQQAGNTLAFNTPKSAVIPSDREASAGQSGAVGTRYTYAELMYQRSYGEDKCSVVGRSVAEQTRTAVSKTKYRDDALELMGNDGWELVSAVTREFNSGFEIFYYLKKKLN